MDVDRSTVRRALEGTEVFGSLGEGELDALAAAARQTRPRAGSRVWTWGTRGAYTSVVMEGTLEICRPSSRGRALLRTIGPGGVVGLSGVAGEPHTADVVAGPRCHLAQIPNRAIESLVRTSPVVALRIIAMLGDLVGRLTDELGQAHAVALGARVARFLLREASGGTVPRTHAAIAASVGATRARVTRALGALQAAGSIRCERGRVVVLRPEQLRRP